MPYVSQRCCLIVWQSLSDGTPCNNNMGAHGTLQEALANVKVRSRRLRTAPPFARWPVVEPPDLGLLKQAYHDASTDEDREAGKTKHKTHKKEKKRKRGSDDAEINGSKKRKKARLAL